VKRAQLVSFEIFSAVVVAVKVTKFDERVEAFAGRRLVGLCCPVATPPPLKKVSDKAAYQFRSKDF
jgi:hypothetical protein